jgi:hypothetical protein
MKAALTAVYDILSADSALNSLVSAEYGKTLKHLFGYKTAGKADDCPVIAYVTPKAEYGLNQHDQGCVVSLVLTIHDTKSLDVNGVELANQDIGHSQFVEFRGLKNSSVLTEAIIQALVDSQHEAFFVSSDFTVFQELPPTTPFFNTEIQFKLSRMGSRNFSK